MIYDVARQLHHAQRRLEAGAGGREDEQQALEAAKAHLCVAVELIDRHLTGAPT